MCTTMSRLTVLLAMALLAVGAAQAVPSEDGAAGQVPTTVTPFIEGTTIDLALTQAMMSDDKVPVIIYLREQPTLSIAYQVQAEYLPAIRERNMAVRAILAKYAGKRDFASEEEMRAQARLEAQAVTAADRALQR